MRLMFWNVRGLGMMHKRGLILKHILQEGLDLVAVQETIRQDFSDKELKDMGGCNSFIWYWIPARGHSGGLLLGAKTEDVELEDVQKADFFIGALVRNRLTNFRFWVLNIYGPAQHEISGDFIQEISGFCSNEELPIVMGVTLTSLGIIRKEIGVKGILS
jgi:exonuclease III